MRWRSGDWEDLSRVSSSFYHGLFSLRSNRSLVIDTLREQAHLRNIGIAYFYCDYGLGATQRFAATILKQLLMHLGPLPQVMLDFYELHKRAGFPRSHAEVSQLIGKLGSHFDACFIVVDALDESHAENQRREIFKVLANLEHLTIKFFITSRPHETDIKMALQKASRIEVQASEEDIRTYLSEKLGNAPRLSTLIDEQLKTQIIAEISQRARGM